ncbi:hypothetical protein [Citrobacter cronae]|uniref:Uncharacterized protein n=1 Tax=Citrobacter cronae TaxID=1748967 RepID=A0A7X1BS82_9ENTR|nr:hypothetical protein [Citrobacter cronae]EBD5843801.1 hypothetical protein [Salmonella enterica]EDD5452673.1 hypothetical protein [Salmonella enterica subsp. enterica serovar Paratyphi B]EBD6593437.1 hypothetical protein [Salmonella enterica]EDE4810607.1 hypothetical protein [Salmonella enterica subsp. enterica serovar Paratyphi B]MBC2622150.1 hypothetical protein [Citrobacter cronae]
MDPTTLHYGIASTIAYLVLTLLLYGVNIGKHMVILTFLFILFSALVGAALAKSLQFDILMTLTWIIYGLCCCILAGGVLYRSVQVYEYFKERKKTKPKTTIIS